MVQLNLSSLNLVSPSLCPSLGEEFPIFRYPIAPASSKLIFPIISPHSRGSEKLAVVGSPFWMAPEVLRDEPYNEKVSLGNQGLVLTTHSWQCPGSPFMFRVRI